MPVYFFVRRPPPRVFGPEKTTRGPRGLVLFFSNLGAKKKNKKKRFLLRRHPCHLVSPFIIFFTFLSIHPCEECFRLFSLFLPPRPPPLLLVPIFCCSCSVLRIIPPVFTRRPADNPTKCPPFKSRSLTASQCIHTYKIRTTHS